MEVLIAMCALHLVALISPGPDFLLVVRNSVRHSHRIGMWTGFGIALGVLVHMTYCILGIGFIISQSIMLFNLLKYLGAAYLVCIGVMSFLSREEGVDFEKEREESRTLKPVDALKMGFYINVLNPKATLAFVSIFSALITPETSYAIQWIFAAFACVSALLWFTFVASVFSIAKVQLAFSKARNRIDRTIGVVLVSLGLRVLDV